MLLGPHNCQGHVKIWNPESGEIFVDKKNAIHYENMSVAMAQSLANRTTGFIQSMAFGNGASAVDPTGVITYLPPNTTGSGSDLYNETYTKVINDLSALNSNPLKNKMEIRHISGAVYSDILITCLLDYGEPAAQAAFDNTTDFNSDYVFDELGLKSYEGEDITPKLLTHVVFHPVQKSLNRLIQIDYTIRIQSLSTFTEPT